MTDLKEKARELWREETPEGIEALIMLAKKMHADGRLDIGLITTLHDHYMRKVGEARNSALEEAAVVALLNLNNPRTDPYAKAEAQEIADRIRALKDTTPSD